MTGSAPKTPDAIVDTILAHPQSKFEDTTADGSPAAWGISVEQIMSDKELRLDAAHFDPASERRLSSLKAAGVPFRLLGDITANVFMPPRQSRNYIEDPELGVPFLHGRQITSFRPDGLQTISRHSRNFDRFVIKDGWILLTRSGTVGKVAICPNEWDGWAASDHIFRIVPDAEKCPPGYLYCCLVSDIAQMQLSAQAYGGQIDELTEDHIRNLQIPILDKTIIDEIDQKVTQAKKAREKAAALLDYASASFSKGFLDYG